MKRFLCLVLCAIMLALCGCSKTENESYKDKELESQPQSITQEEPKEIEDESQPTLQSEEAPKPQETPQETPQEKPQIKPVQIGEYISGIWFSYSEIDTLLNSSDFASEVKKAAQKCKEKGITDAFIHVRAFGETLYPSKYFPQKRNAAALGDPFERIITEFGSKGIRIHAWINPYRLRTADSDISKLHPESPAVKWLNDKDAANDINVCFWNGIYFNPASVEVQRLCLDSARELFEKYEISGMHIDDYFYPTVSAEFDKDSYLKYAAEASAAKTLSLFEWRRENVNALVSGYYKLTKAAGNDKIFSISPAADIDKNLNQYYADVELWCGGGYADWIIPQLYFGFEYPNADFRFEGLLKKWKALNFERKISLIIGLASYKIGTSQQPDAAEWANGKEIILRQAEICKNDPLINGHVYFSYSSEMR